MNYDSDEKIIKDALSTIHTPKYNMAMEVEKKINNPKTYINFKRAIPLVVCLCLIFSVGVMAETIPSFQKLLSIVSTDIGLLLQPVKKISEDQGIKMEVLGAMNDDEMAVVYFTMQDLTGNRIDKTLDIYEYSLNGANMFNCQIINYDEVTKTAILRMQANGGEKLNGKKVSFRIGSFLSDKKTFDKRIDISDIKIANSSQKIPLDMSHISGGGGTLYKEFKQKGSINVLKTDQMNIAIPKIDFVHISNIGYIDGKLHIQTKCIGDGIDDHGYMYFADSLGNQIDMKSANIHFGTDPEGNTKYGSDYIEYIFDMGDIEVDKLKLMGYFVSNGNYVEGNWETTFKIQSVGETKEKDCNIQLDNGRINRICLSPMGITLLGRGESEDVDDITVSAKMTDGSIQTFDSMMSYSEDEEIKLKFVSFLPLDISKVQYIMINDTIIN
ncbi:DUF4179 domain-containing protein [Inediibacterium massiliense]|uniref:DUF4179 domain-containing protein n=1 Tax=Inediibacterium massiliense TaxID=1658111 RepID=UPI0006B55CFB|nr:DUF4179 domain-containing protein [Inediibacterium massiliense]